MDRLGEREFAPLEKFLREAYELSRNSVENGRFWLRREPQENAPYRLADKLQAFLASLPEDSKDKTYYRDKIKAYSNECGCSMGASFLLGSVGVLAAYLCLAMNWHDFHLTKVLLLGLTFIIGSSICGKLIGIAIARVRLFMLFRSIRESRDS